MKDDTVKLVLNDREISGWTGVRVTRGIERLPSDFDVGITELYPDELAAVVVTPGDSCVLKAGDDVLISGYIDRYIPAIDATGHGIRIAGRGKCQDLVDCSAEWPNSQMSAATAFQIAKNLASAYPGLSVICDADDLIIVPQFNILLGETAFEVIDRVCKYSSLLPYDGPDGNLILSRVGTEQHSSGFFEGQNVLGASVEYSSDQRFQTYIAYLNAMVRIGSDNQTGNVVVAVSDSGVLRNRKRYLIAEAIPGFYDLVGRRAIWEMNRRNGRSVVVRLSVDSWRDSDGALWTPNKLVPVYLPKLKLVDHSTGGPVNWIIGEVTFLKGEMGTTADLLIMAPAAYEIEPHGLLYGILDGATMQ